MSEQCLALVDSVKLANKKISMNDLLDLCDEYDLSPNEVDWVTNSLSPICQILMKIHLKVCPMMTH